MTVALKHGALRGVPARIVSWGYDIVTLGESDRLVTIAYDVPQQLTGRPLSRLDCCLSELDVLPAALDA